MLDTDAGPSLFPQKSQPAEFQESLVSSESLGFCAMYHLRELFRRSI